MKNITNYLLLGLILWSGLSSFAGHGFIRCSSTEVLQRQLKADPSMQQRMDQIEQFTNDYVKKASAHRNSGSANANAVAATVTIPVVFHVVYNTTAQNVSDVMIQNQLAVLNADYGGTNSDISGLPSVFSGIKAGNTGIQFCMAQRDPSGNATTGIVRKSTTTTSFIDDDKVKKSTTGGDNAWDATKYLNIWLCNLGGGLLGYAQFPGGAAATDGVVILYSSLPGGTAAPYDKGRTMTHEVGHWLNLRHIWGDANCGNDLVSDTPTQQTSNFGCPSFPHVTCSNGPNGDLFQNYMDYTDDACMFMLTAGQSSRMNALFVSGGARVGMVTSQGCVPPSTTCGTPSGLASSSITTTGATVSWTAVSGATSYSLQYKIAAATTWTTISGITTTSRALTGLTAGTTYNFQVSATCSTGTSAYSTASSFTTSTAATCGVPTGLGSSSVTTTGATVSWSAVSGATSYTLQYKTSAATLWTTVSGITTTSRALSGLTAGTTYNFQVSATCASGTSAYSTASSFTTASSATCGVPSGLASSAITTTSATVSWSAVSGATSYSLQYKISTASTWTTVSGITTTSSALSGLTAGTTYNFQVSATCSSGTSAYSTASSFTTSSSTGVTYCTVKGSTQAYEWIDLVNINSINRTSGKETGGYVNTGLSTNLVIGSTNDTIRFSAGFTSTIYTEYWKIYIDFNKNGVFTDAGETVVSGGATGSGTYYSTFSVPSTVTAGPTRMRVLMSDNSASTSCGTFTYGEVEDYTVNLSTSLTGREGGSVMDNTGTVYSSDTRQIANEPVVSKMNLLSKDALLSIYPNPASDRITVQAVANGNGTIRIYNLVGQKVINLENSLTDGENSLQINTSELNQGVYILEMDNAGEIVRKKFTITK